MRLGGHSNFKSQLILTILKILSLKVIILSVNYHFKFYTFNFKFRSQNYKF